MKRTHCQAIVLYLQSNCPIAIQENEVKAASMMPVAWLYLACGVWTVEYGPGKTKGAPRTDPNLAYDQSNQWFPRPLDLDIVTMLVAC